VTVNATSAIGHDGSKKPRSRGTDCHRWRDRFDAPGASLRAAEQRRQDMWSYVDPSARSVARPEGLHLSLCGGYPPLNFPAAAREFGLKTEQNNSKRGQKPVDRELSFEAE
jgi:hypothetical protein